MLCGNRESMVGDAIASVIPWVDTLLLLDTGITDRSLERACEIAGDKLAVVSYPWRNDFAAARNAALDFAEQLDADWALTIDTDERLRFPPDCPRADWDASLAAAPPVAAWLVPDQQRGYAKERLIRLPAAGRWRGETHEAFILNRTARRDRHPWLTFWELAKTPEQMQHKLSRDLQILQRLTANDPDNGRWWFYLGQTLEGLHRYAEAQAAFEQSFPLEAWGEQAAWAAYCAARCAFEQEAYAESIDRCSMGLAVQPQSPELLWLAGLCALRRRQLGDAICWSELAAHLGSRPELITFRIAFRHLPAWFEGPHDVLRFAYRAAGNRRAAAQAEADYVERRQERLQLHPAEYAATEDPATAGTHP
jgi:tetratricopeptide (TPR) repeat protein